MYVAHIIGIDSKTTKSFLTKVAEITLRDIVKV